MSIIIYATESGEIRRCVSCPPDLYEVQCGEDESFIEAEAVDNREWYVRDGALALRPYMDPHIAGLTISNLPQPTVLTVRGLDYVVTDGEAELSFEAPGVYPVRLRSFPFVEETVEVTQP